jgi:hypothetical protein
MFSSAATQGIAGRVEHRARAGRGAGRTAGAVATGTWVDIDVTSAVTGNGTYSFMATSPSTNTAQFSSREVANAPSVVVVP